MNDKDISDISYADSGVSLEEGDKVGQEIIKVMKAKGLEADGLFGGSIDVSHLKKEKSIPLSIVGEPLSLKNTPYDSGFSTANSGLDRAKKNGLTPIMVLDYYASLTMDEKIIPKFAEGVATASLAKNAILIGGESAQMPGIFKPGKADAYVHIIFTGKGEITIDIAPLIKNMEQPFLYGSTDGTGTKTKRVRNPEDIIFHGSNDLGVMGVKPIGFALYVAGNVPKSELLEIIGKSNEICNKIGISNLGSTLCVDSNIYEQGQVDIAGTVIGVADNKSTISGKRVEKEDVIIGFATDGLMTNGYSLADKILATMESNGQLNDQIKEYVNEELSRPHVPYTDILFGYGNTKGILEKFPGVVKATAHITGGGQKDNVSRMVPKGLVAAVKKEQLPLPNIIEFFRKNASDLEKMDANLYPALNMGVGLTATVEKEYAQEVIKYCNTNFANRIEGVTRTAAQIGAIEATKFYFVN